MKTLVSISRIFVGILFIISGFIKLNDPLGFSYKLQEYFSAEVLNLPFLEPYALIFSIFVVVFEVVLGVFLLIGYIGFLFIKKDPPEEVKPNTADLQSYIYFFIGLIMIVSGGHLMVKHASNVAHAMGVSDWVIAVTIVAAGTSAPEFATSVSAAIKGRHGIAIGNLIGSDLFNLLGVLGLAGILNPTNISSDIFNSVFLLVLMVGITLLMIRTNWRISRLEGTILVSINLIRWYFDFAA